MSRRLISLVLFVACLLFSQTAALVCALRCDQASAHAAALVDSARSVSVPMSCCEQVTRQQRPCPAPDQQRLGNTLATATLTGSLALLPTPVFEAQPFSAHLLLEVVAPVRASSARAMTLLPGFPADPERLRSMSLRV